MCQFEASTPPYEQSFQNTHGSNIVQSARRYQLWQTPGFGTVSGGPKSVINVSSVSSQMYQPWAVGYCSSKAAANQVITHFAFDNPEGNVKFFNIHPGAVHSQMVKDNGLSDLAIWEDGKQ